MQDFAKSRIVAARDSVQPVGHWKIDAGSVLFGVLLGALVVFTGFKAADYREMQPSNEEPVQTTAIVESGIDFEFYEILKRGGFSSLGSNE
jgi:hypothetical protein